MKRILIIAAILVIGVGGAYIAFDNHGTTGVAQAEESQQLYTCGMHPQIISKEPGYCPICGMKLTPKKDNNVAMKGSIVVDPTVVQNMGMVVADVSRQQLQRKVRVFGKIQYTEPSIQSVNVKIPGWVEKLYIDYEGQSVKKGQPLFLVYSPELVAAQQEYLVALKNKQALGNSGSNNLLQAAVMRLENWDISQEQITRLSDDGQLTRTMLIRSPFDGVVITKRVAVGEHLNPGAEIYRIADISKVWVQGYAYEQDLPYISTGQTAEVSVPSLPNKTFSGKIIYVSPFLNDANQAEIRIETTNPDLLLKPDMYAEVNINSRLDGGRLAVPRKAVINSGAKEIVYLAEGDGSYEPRLITTGASADGDLLEVTSGLNEGDKIVTSGQFLLDSESRLNESLGMNHNHGSMASSDTKDEQMNDMAMDTHQHSDDMKTDDNSSMEVKKPGQKQVQPKLSGIYTCPMPEHYHVLQYGPGTCPECGMKLVPIEQTKNTEVYVCPMSEDSVVSDKPGKCLKCGMDLVKLDSDKQAMDMSGEHEMAGHEHNHAAMTDSSHMEMASGIYTCPMKSDYDVVQYGPGKCPKCGMNLVPVEKTGNKSVYYCPMPKDKYVSNKPGNCPVCGMKLQKLEPGTRND